MADFRRRLSSRPSKAWLLLIPVGLVLYVWTVWLDPIHEMVHAVAAWLVGGEVIALEWSQIWTKTYAPEFVTFFGFGGEILLYGALALIFKRAGLFAYGALVPIGIFATGSVDFGNLSRGALVFMALIWVAVVCAVGYVTVRRYWFPKTTNQAERTEPTKKITPTLSTFYHKTPLNY